jgi:hypothetical protein
VNQEQNPVDSTRERKILARETSAGRELLTRTKITWAIHCLGARFAEQKIMSDKDRQLDLAEKTRKSAPGSRRERDPEPKTGARRKTTLSSVNCRTESVEAEKLKPWRRNSSSCAEIGD